MNLGLAGPSRIFWDRYPLVEVGSDVTAEESQAIIDRRHIAHPEMRDLVPLDFPGQTVLDFGCGPGDDTIAFLQNDAAHVYAADISPRVLEMVKRRVEAHGFKGRCTTIYIPENVGWIPPVVNHVHAAGVLHHCADPVQEMDRLRTALRRGGYIWAMVYSSESDFYQRICGADSAVFRDKADGGAPIVNAWTRAEFTAMAAAAGLKAFYVGSYHHFEDGGPGLSSCWELER